MMTGRRKQYTVSLALQYILLHTYCILLSDLSDLSDIYDWWSCRPTPSSDRSDFTMFRKLLSCFWRRWRSVEHNVSYNDKIRNPDHVTLLTSEVEANLEVKVVVVINAGHCLVTWTPQMIHILTIFILKAIIWIQNKRCFHISWAYGFSYHFRFRYCWQH